MAVDITVKIGGEAGQGIQTVGELLTLVCHKAGLYVMAINDFESRIRGGKSFFQIRISDKPVYAPHHRVNLIVALNQRTYDSYKDELVPGGISMMDVKGELEENQLPVPINDLAVKAGKKITANTVAAGACLGLLGAPFELFESILKDRFEGKGGDALEMNLSAARLGYDSVKDAKFPWSFTWQFGDPKGSVLNGSKAIALGALAGDCRVAAFYPMSPATGIMVNLSSLSDDFPLFVEQAEDEIAAINMVIGASFAGVRAMTSTSGGGFCLMTEGIGLAGITETPIVVVNAQRPGPATGLPTRTAQGDLMFVINASQDEFPRFVFAPGTPSEAFEMTERAFHLADKYQVPAIVLTDQTLNDSLYITERPLSAPREIERYVVGDDQIDSPSEYCRYAITSSGISPRALPCSGKALVLVSGNEHSEDGHISEAITDRMNMVNKRNAKTSAMLEEMRPPETYHGESELLLVGWGSSKGPIRESVDRLREDGISAGCVHIADIWPFRADLVQKALSSCKTFFVVEQNSTAQLGRLIREQTGLVFEGSVLKYDGRPFFPDEIVRGIKAYLTAS
ncbi:MAG: 2-oxoacid:acceptor oxidoreductase subunit alpha [Deltaproteobacteria bacterium]|nr:2-oxoacid:acceptor oxidoreductase subunit alpha [Deltaproteobacteria bacterium]